MLRGVVVLKLVPTLERLPRFCQPFSVQTLMSVMVYQNMVVYNYRILKPGGPGDMDTRLFNETRQQTMNMVCTNPETKAMIALGAIMRFTYYNQNGVYLKHFDIGPSSCDAGGQSG
jgi:hypothetical protein